MTDDPTRGNDLDEADVVDDEETEDERPIVVLNPAMQRVSGRASSPSPRSSGARFWSAR